MLPNASIALFILISLLHNIQTVSITLENLQAFFHNTFDTNHDTQATI